MDMQKTIAFLAKQCQLYEMMLRNISNLADVAPREILERQLEELEAAMVQKQETVSAYFPRSRGYIYVLKLEGDAASDAYYYVGYTQDVERRLQEHFGGDGSEWTKAHKPVSVLEVGEGEKADERHKTIEVMKKYGWSKTRGYCWTARNLRSPPRELDL